ncbi:hypothetical protein ACSBR1_014412 [Camellia fascicularis]
MGVFILNVKASPLHVEASVNDLVYNLEQVKFCIRFGLSSTVKGVACEVLELIAEGLRIEPRIVFDELLRDEKSECIEICLRDGTWVSVLPDANSFFISVVDCLQQVMTNGRLKSVRHKAKSKLKECNVESGLHFCSLPIVATAASCCYC